MSEKKQAEARTPYVLEVEPLVFESDAECMTLTSTELCNLTNEYFKAAFADYAGCKFETVGGAPSITLCFSHIKHDEDSDLVYACDMTAGKVTGNNVIDRTRAYDRLVKEGDRYHLTENGKDVIKELLMPKLANDKNLNWGKITADFIDRSQATYFNPNNAQVLTKVMSIDPNAMCAKLFGAKGFGYSVQIRGDLYAHRPGVTGSQNYVLNILRVDNKTIQKTYEKLGIGVIGSDFVRA